MCMQITSTHTISLYYMYILYIQKGINIGINIINTIVIKRTNITTRVLSGSTSVTSLTQWTCFVSACKKA